MLWKINLSIGFVDKNLKKLLEAKIAGSQFVIRSVNEFIDKE